jgi:hypothetical protein
MSLITPGLLASRGQIMPNRKSVQVYRQLPRDAFAEPYTAIAEVRLEKKGVSGGAEGQTEQITREFIFQQVDLGSNEINDDDVIRYGDKFYKVGGVSIEQQEQRVRCPTIKTVSPLIQVD